MIISNREKTLYWVVFLLLVIMVVGVTWYISSGKLRSNADVVTSSTTKGNSSQTNTSVVNDKTMTGSNSSDISNKPTISLQSGWNLKTIPYILSPNDGKTSLLGLDTREAYAMGLDGTWSSLYDSGSITPGEGVWIRSDLGQAYQLPVQAQAVSLEKSFTIPLHKGWNAIGDPFPSDITWNPTVQTSKGSATFAKAVELNILTNGYIPDTTGKVYATVKPGDQLKAFQGMLIKSGGDNINLIVTAD